MTFDEQVAALRGKVEPKHFKGKKADATPEQWAAYLAYVSRRHAASPGAGRNRAARWRASNPERSRVHRDKWRAANKDRERDRRAKYRADNADAVRERNRQYLRERRSKDACFRLSVVLRQRLCSAVKGNARSGSAVRDLGCSIEDLKSHIERQWTGSMSWENWGRGPGTWQIDHVYPMAQTDLTDRAQLLAVCNWRNLQPLWHGDNVRKGDTVTPEAQQLFDGLASEFGGA